MNMIQVESTSIFAIGFDEINKILAVKFFNKTYEYKGVPINIFNDFLNSTSKGQYFNLFIKNNFQCCKTY